MSAFYRIILLIVFIAALPVQASDLFYRLELASGLVYNKARHVTVKQDDYPDITFKAEFDSKPFERPVYYALRFARWQQSTAWGFEFIHDKLYVDDTPADIQRFEISHGFNVFTVNRAWDTGALVFHLGAGTIVTHPDMTIRDERSENGDWYEGYHVGGVALQGALQKRFAVSQATFLSLEVKLLYADTHVPVPNGSVHIINESAHFLLGYGGDF